MRTLFEKLKEEINVRVPEFKTVELWEDQINESLVERTGEGFPYPAVFIDLIQEEVFNRLLGVKDIVVRIDFHFAFEGYTRDKGVKHMDLIDNFDSKMHRLQGDDFNSLIQVVVDLDQDRNNVDKPIRSYRTLWRDPGSYKDRIDGEITTTTINGTFTS